MPTTMVLRQSERSVAGGNVFSKKPNRLVFSPSNVHNTFTHFPKDPNCDICNGVKRNRAQCRQKVHGKPDQLPAPTAWSHSLSADHVILNEQDESREQDRVAMVCLDRFTRWLQGYAAKTKSAKECSLFFKRFLGPQCKPEHVYTDNSQEFQTSLKELGWPHDTSTPHRSQTNGVIERAIRVLKEGSSCVLVQSGLSEQWWPEALRGFCFLRNVSD